MRVVKSIWFISLVCIFLIYTLFGFFGIPYVVKNILPKKLDEKTHIKASFEKVYFNPFTYYLELHEAKFFDSAKKPLLDVKNFHADLNFLQLFKKNISFKNIDFNSPKIYALIDKKGNLNLVPPVKSEENNDTKASSWNFEIVDLDIKNANINFEGHNLKEPLKLSLKPLNFHAKNLSTKKNMLSSQEFKTKSSSAKNVDYNGTMSLNPLSAKGVISIKDLDINSFVGYGLGKRGIYPKDARVDIRLSYDLSILNKQIKLNLNNVNLVFLHMKLFAKKEKLVSIKKLDLNDFDLSLDTNTSSFNVKKGSLKVDNIKFFDSSLLALKGDLKRAYLPSIFLKYDFNGSFQSSLAKLDLDSGKFIYDKLHEGNFNKLKIKDFSLQKNKEFNILTKNIELENLAVKSKKIEKSFAKFKHIKLDDVSIDKTSFLTKSIKLNGGDVKYILSKNDKNKQIAKEQNRTKKSDFKFLIKSLNLANLGLDFAHEDKFKQKISNINLNAKNITNDSAKKIDLTLNAEEKGVMRLKASANITPSPFELKANYDLFYNKLNLINPYLKDYITLNLPKGKIKSDGKISYINDGLNLNANLNANGVELLDKSKKVFSFANLGVKSLNYNEKKQDLSIQNITLLKPQINFISQKNGKNNMDNIFIKSKGSKKQSKPLNIYLKNLKLTNGKFILDDKTLLNPSRLKISSINGDLTSFYLPKRKHANLKLNANLNDTGYLSVSGKFIPKDFKLDTNINTDIRNLNIKTLNSYTQNYLGYNTKKGVISTNVVQNIQKGKLKGQSDTFIEHFKLGSSVKSKDAVAMPLEAGLMLLSDSNGDVRLSIPISGDMNSPDFSYGGVILNAIVKFFTGIVTAPFNILGNVLGIDADKLRTVDFQPASDKLVISENAKMNQYVKIIKKRPQLKLLIKGAYDKNLDANGTKDLLSLANKRAEAIKSELLKKGVSEENIIIKKPISVKSRNGIWVSCEMGIK